MNPREEWFVMKGWGKTGVIHGSNPAGVIIISRRMIPRRARTSQNVGRMYVCRPIVGITVIWGHESTMCMIDVNVARVNRCTGRLLIDSQSVHGISPSFERNIIFFFLPFFFSLVFFFFFFSRREIRNVEYLINTAMEILEFGF